MSSRHRSTRTTTLNDVSDTAFAMALLWAMPAIGFLLIFARL
ncbi:hypothetical protein [Nocardioides halotolerans]|jgi:hypothetical protein|nr:hypothetical protein [Nocardioides halotolerans]